MGRNVNFSGAPPFSIQAVYPWVNGGFALGCCPPSPLRPLGLLVGKQKREGRLRVCVCVIVLDRLDNHGMFLHPWRLTGYRLDTNPLKPFPP